MKEMTIASFNEQDKAEHLRDRLEQAGLHAEIMDESKLQKYWFLSQPHAAVKIRVDEKDFERARELLRGLDAVEDALHDAVRCPQCGSSRVDYPQFTRKFVSTTLVEVFCFLHLVEKMYYCQDCQYTWPDHPVKDPAPWDGSGELNILGWPKKEAKGAVEQK
jgi:hypothetical protein